MVLGPLTPARADRGTEHLHTSTYSHFDVTSLRVWSVLNYAG
jgi:hypothetical protein